MRISHRCGWDEIPGREKSRNKDSERGEACGLEERTKGPEHGQDTGEHRAQPRKLGQNGEVEPDQAGCRRHSQEFAFHTKCQSEALPSDWHL